MKHFKENFLHFCVVFVVVLIVTTTILYSLGFIPNELENQTREDTLAFKLKQGALSGLGLTATDSDGNVLAPHEKGELPYRIVASSISLDSTIELTTSNDNITLDQALTLGPVYYPGSGIAGNGNMFIFGHSTSYQIVNNKAYQVFNNIKNLKSEDGIEVYGHDKVYFYKVRQVRLVNKDEALVDFSTGKNMLTLSTCNSFGQKSDRYVVEADFSHSKAITTGY